MTTTRKPKRGKSNSTKRAASRTRRRGPVRVLIVEDHPIVREGLRTLLERERDFCVCGELEGSRGALTAMRELKPDVVILDLSLRDDGDGLTLAKSIHAQHPSVPVVVLSIHDELVYAKASLKAGAMAYVMKDQASTVIVTALRQVLRGEIYVSERVKQDILRVFAAGPNGTAPDLLETLSDRERQVFRLLGRGHSPKKIAERLYVSRKTIETHCMRIRHKLELQTGREVARVAQQWVSRHEGI